MTRWDSPLFTVPYDDKEPPYEAIWEAIIGKAGEKKIVRPNQSTVLVSYLPHRPSFLVSLVNFLPGSNRPQARTTYKLLIVRPKTS